MDVEDRVVGGSITSSITEGIVRRFEGLAATRDRALGEGRQITRLAANSVRATHRGEIDEAERLLTEARGRGTCRTP
jgi:predicted translin family RNA/ssDNA-binding protein